MVTGPLTGAFADRADQCLAETDDLLGSSYPGDDGSRQPIHTVYLAADQFTADTAVDSAVLDEPATARALARFINRGLNADALRADEIERSVHLTTTDLLLPACPARHGV